ncbi:protein FAR1-RELATED SEQUENCE 5-like [Gastrolobium bilobum]|uniref:protein FAR1-RELATED SEQUENCE 5-like n=1 Tax=Gastrolobium bilobum TaxID=150636 RepID=UPI002AB205DF|nr:protein FAR1-RELATED SEQUENCE 5-like [Gastrolobium bilobum]
MNGAAKNLVEKFNAEGLPTGKVAAMFNGSDLAFSNRDCWNHLRNLRRKNLDVGDAQAVFNYCKQKMINFFWVDARSRFAYQQFGDVITFDTTYRTNKYSMPFAPFTGLNHHLQSILFGCALLQDESEKSFVWFFETWLEAMNGKKPVSMITDQDLAIGAAVAKVFPETRHRLCLWHIRKKFPEKFAHIYHKNSTFKRELKRCIRESSSIKDFEDDWQRIMVEYSLLENEWLQRLFDIRESWTPVHNRSTFFAGMNTTQRSESINSFLDSFVNSTTTLRDFVVKFEKAINNRYEAEIKENFESRHKSRTLTIGSKIEEHAASIYTRNVFVKFHNELVSHFTKEKIEKNGSHCKYRHILVIFQAKNIIRIPCQYILERWTKEANKCIEVGDIEIWNNESNVLRSMNVQRKFDKFSNWAKRSEDAYKFIISKLDRIYNMASTMGMEIVDVNEDPIGSNQQNLTCDTTNDASDFNIKDPYVSHTKGRRRKDFDKVPLTWRFKGGLELSINKALVKRRAYIISVFVSADIVSIFVLDMAKACSSASASVSLDS